MDKKGAERTLSVYWFAILIIVSGAIIAMVTMFYSYPYDVREIEGNLAINKFAGCISEGGILNSELFEGETMNQNFGSNFIDFCDFDFEDSSYDELQYYFEATFYSDTGESLLDFNYGNSNWKQDCSLDEEDYGRLAKCVEREFFSVDSQGNIYSIKVLSIVGKLDKNVK